MLFTDWFRRKIKIALLAVIMMQWDSMYVISTPVAPLLSWLNVNPSMEK